MNSGWRLLVPILALPSMLGLSGAARADDACLMALTKSTDKAIVATGTLAAATKYMTSHDDWCDGNLMALKQQDGDAVDHAWSAAIDAQGQCVANPKAQEQMTRLVDTLHRRRIKISSDITALRNKCD